MRCRTWCFGVTQILTIITSRTLYPNGTKVPWRALLPGQTVFEVGQILAVQTEGDLVRGDRSFAKDTPRVAFPGEIDDGGGDGAGGGSPIDDERDLLTELVVHAPGVRALRHTVQVRRRSGDGQAEPCDDRSRDGGLRDAKGDVSRVCGDAEREFGTRFDDDGERAWPETFGEAVEGGVTRACEPIGLGHIGDQERQWLVTRTIFEVIDAIDGAEINWIDGQTVEGIGRKGDDLTGFQVLDDVIDERRLWFIGVNTEDLSRQRACSFFLCCLSAFRESLT